MAKLIEFTERDGANKVFVNPDNVLYARHNVGNKTLLVFAVLDNDGYPHSIVVDDLVSEVSKKLSR